MSAEPGTSALQHDAAGSVWPSACGTARPGVGRPAVAALFAILIGLVLAVRLGLTINNDVAWYIYSAKAFLDGGRLYDDVFFEVNPPLMLYLTVPGVALARLAGIGLASGYLVSVFAVVALSLSLCAGLLPAGRRFTTLILAPLVLTILPAGDFGQRSHLMVALTLPYLLLVCARLHDEEPCRTSLAAVVGAAAGLGFAIKPHYLLVPATLALMLWWQTRRPGSALRAETLALGSVLAAYAGAILAFTPEYLTRVVPYALEVYNSAYRNGWSFVLARPETLLVPIAALLHLRVRRSLAAPDAAMGDVLTAAALALFAIYLIQMKGWNYHIYPVTAMLVLLAGNLGLSPTALRTPLRLAPTALAGLLVIKAAILADNRYPLMDRLMPYIRANGAEAIYFFSSNTWTGFPLTLYADVAWASRFPALWLLPGIVNARSGGGRDGDLEALASIDRFTTEAVIADLSARPPDVVFVDARPVKPWYQEPGLDFIAHFSADPRFAALWARYTLIEEIDGFEIYGRRRYDR